MTNCDICASHPASSTMQSVSTGSTYYLCFDCLGVLLTGGTLTDRWGFVFSVHDNSLAVRHIRVLEAMARDAVAPVTIS